MLMAPWPMVIFTGAASACEKPSPSRINTRSDRRKKLQALASLDIFSSAARSAEKSVALQFPNKTEIDHLFRYKPKNMAFKGKNQLPNGVTLARRPEVPVPVFREGPENHPDPSHYQRLGHAGGFA